MDAAAVNEVLESNLQAVQTSIRAACDRAGRDPSAVKLVAVTKYAEPEWVAALSRVHRVFGESRPQQLAARVAEFDPQIEWHLIGQLQRNKVRLVLPLAHTIHSVESWRLLDRIDLIAGDLRLRPRVLIEVNVSGESAKSGFAPAELLSDIARLSQYENVNVTGLMTMAPAADHAEQSRPVFRQLAELRDQLRERTSCELDELSMGMSGDFEVAIEEGATIVRVGSRLFDGLNYRA